MSHPSSVNPLAVAVPCPEPRCMAPVGAPCRNNLTKDRRATTRPHYRRHLAWLASPTTAVLRDVAVRRADAQRLVPPMLLDYDRADLIELAAGCVLLAEDTAAPVEPTVLDSIRYHEDVHGLPQAERVEPQPSESWAV